MALSTPFPATRAHMTLPSPSLAGGALSGICSSSASLLQASFAFDLCATTIVHMAGTSHTIPLTPVAVVLTAAPAQALAAPAGLGAEFIGDALNDTADAAASLLSGVIGGTVSDLRDAVGDHFLANAGNDFISAGAGNDLIEGGLGSDTLKGGDGDDTIDGGAGQDILDGGAGVNTASFALAIALVKVVLANSAAYGGAGSDTLIGFANVTGSGFDDTLIGDGGSNQLSGLAGNDSLIGGDGDDLLTGGAGDDRLVDLTGLVSLDGGLGNDAFYLGAAMTGTVEGGSGTDALVLGGLTASITGLALSGVEELQTFGTNVTGLASQFDALGLIRNDGTGSNDGIRVKLTLQATGQATALDLSDVLNTGTMGRGVQLTGSADAETLSAGNGADILSGGQGDDMLLGGQGADQLVGDEGDDQLIGGAQDDRLYGGDGHDLYFGGAGSDAFQDDFVGGMAVYGDEGDDQVTVVQGGAVTGFFDGSVGNDILIVTDATDISALTLTSVEVLSTFGNVVTGRATQFNQFTAFLTRNPSPGERVALILTATGGATTLDLSASSVSVGVQHGVWLATTSDDETITTGAGSDTLLGGGGADVIHTGDGNDRIVFTKVGVVSVDAGSGNDRVDLGSTPSTGSIAGGDGTDTLSGGRNIAALSVTGFEVLETPQGETFRATASQLAAFTQIRAGDAASTADLSLALVAMGGDTVLDLTEKLSDAVAERAVTLFGTPDNETLTTTGADDLIFGGLGNDMLSGGGGQDTLYGGDGNDVLQDLASTSATLQGGLGDDRLVIGTAISGVMAGGDGVDELAILAAYGMADLSGLTLGGVEGLVTGGATVTARVVQLLAFQTIASGTDTPISLILSAMGTTTALDLSLRVDAGAAITLTGSSDAEGVTGGFGDDQVMAGAGNDVLTGLDGNDLLYGEANDDQLFGGAGNDQLIGGDGTDILSGGDDNDRLTDFANTPLSMRGDDGDDTVSVLGSGTLTGTLTGGAGNDLLILRGPNSLVGVTISGFERLEAAGNQIGLASQFAGFTTILPEAQSPKASLALTLHASDTATALDLSNALNAGGGPRGVDLTTSTDAEDITLGDGNDTVTAGGGDVIVTGGGQDTVSVLTAGPVTVRTGAGDDAVSFSPQMNPAANLDGGDGVDILRASGSFLGCTLGHFEVLVTDGGAVTATAAQLQGFVRIVSSLTRPDDPVILRLAASGAGNVLDLWAKITLGAAMHGVDLTGSADDETLTTGAADDTVDGGAGNDEIATGGGADLIRDHGGASLTINAGLGNDVIDITATAFTSGKIDGGFGFNTLRAGDAVLSGLTLCGLQVLDTGGGTVQATATQLEDFFRIQSTAGPVRLTLSATGTATTLDLAGELNQSGPRSAFLTGSEDAEAMTTGGGNDSLDGGDGRDLLVGGFGTDVLRGGAGVDTLVGGKGEDLLSGDGGIDQLFGGAGDDTFWLHLAKPPDVDIVRDFTSAEDHILLSRAEFGDFDTVATGTLGAADWFVANAGAVAADSNDQFLYDTTTGRLYFDSDGLGGLAARLVATFHNTLTGTPNLTAADFVVQEEVSFGF